MMRMKPVTKWMECCTQAALHMVTVSFSAINPDEAFEFLEVMQLFNSSRDGVTVPGTYTRAVPQVHTLSTIVLNSRDWYKIIWLPEILCFNN